MSFKPKYKKKYVIQSKSVGSNVVLGPTDFHCMHKQFKQSKSLEYVILCSAEEIKSYRFGST